MKTYSIQVYGKVQGVWYRASTQRKALSLGLTGTVQNEPNGSVSILASGEEKIIQNLIDWCKEGPPHAKVERVESKEITIQNFSSFEVIR